MRFQKDQHEKIPTAQEFQRTKIHQDNHQECKKRQIINVLTKKPHKDDYLKYKDCTSVFSADKMARISRNQIRKNKI